jgi:hypothetical protein
MSVDAFSTWTVTTTPAPKATINHRDNADKTALWWACRWSRGGFVRALLESGADHTVAKGDGTTPTAIAKGGRPFSSTSAPGRQECVAALARGGAGGETLLLTVPPSSTPALLISLAEVLGVVGGRRRSGPISCGRLGRWPTSRGAVRWRSGGDGGAWRRRRRRGRTSRWTG